MAGEDNTQVTRNNKNNVIIGINFLDSGEAVEFDIDQGDIIISDRPVQVHLLTGDIGNKYELRWYALVSRHFGSQAFGTLLRLTCSFFTTFTQL